MSKLGFCSRSQAVVWVHEGRVQVNGITRLDPEWPTRIIQDRIQVNGHSVGSAPLLYLMLNKPRGLVTTAADERGRPTVFRCLANHDLPHLSPVGRLDKASEGLLLFTNDTAWAARLAAPHHAIERVYHVQVNAIVDEALLQRLVGGITDHGEFLGATGVRLLRRGTRRCWIEVRLDEGRNRHIRRLLGAFCLEVVRLVRVAIGPLSLGSLAKGAFRHLSEAERRVLQRRQEAEA